MASQEEPKKDYEKLEQGDDGAKDAEEEDDGNKTQEPLVIQQTDPESKPPKEKPHPGARRRTYQSIGIALLIVLFVIVIIAVVAAVLITQDKSGSGSTVLTTPSKMLTNAPGEVVEPSMSGMSTAAAGSLSAATETGSVAESSAAVVPTNNVPTNNAQTPP